MSVTQLPLIYCLSCKINLISLITGISYERLNWFHRWAARTLFLTIVVHWSFFFREWSIANFVQLEISMMPMVKYGFGAWSVIAWMVLTGFGYFRTLSHELFVLQHIATACILLWLVHVHVPSYAAYNVWLAVGFVAFDWAGRTVFLLARNLHVLPILSGKGLRRHTVGYSAQVEVLPDNYVSITVEGVNFSWRSGQHVYLTVPGCGFFGLLEAHPFTIANLPDLVSESQPKQLKVYFKAQSGFTKRLLDQCLSREDQVSCRVLVSGPWGNPPLNVVHRSDSLILLATSTGASFTIPILQSIVANPLSLRRIRFYWVVRHFSQIAWFESSLIFAIREGQSKGIDLIAQVFITGHSDSRKEPWPQTVDHSARWRPKISEGDEVGYQGLPRRVGSTYGSTSSDNSVSKKRLLQENPPTFYSTPVSELNIGRQRSANSTICPALSDSAAEKSSFIAYSGRPKSLDDLIRPTVEESDGETSIVACGSVKLLAQLRNYTAVLSDERAVHKGTGAQGIFLFTENYGW